MRKPGLTSHDVARLAGVSRATVSIVLSGSDAAVISADTRARVRKAASDLGYRPNSAARMLKSGATRTIGLVVSDEEVLKVDGFVPILFQAICAEMRAKGYHVLLESLVGGGQGNPYTDLVESRRIDGVVILNPPTADAHLTALIESGFPTVLVGTIGHPSEVSTHFRGRGALAEAVSRLVGLGHRDFGCITFSPQGFVATDRRVLAIRSVLARHGLALPDDCLRYGRFSAESGHAAALSLIAAQPEVRAIFAGNDTLAIGVLAALREKGLRVPEDVSVIGFDDLPFAAYLNPPLTTIRVDAEAQGRSAARQLLHLLDDTVPEPRQVALEATLIWRASCGARTCAEPGT